MDLDDRYVDRGIVPWGPMAKSSPWDYNVIRSLLEMHASLFEDAEEKIDEGFAALIVAVQQLQRDILIKLNQIRMTQQECMQGSFPSRGAAEEFGENSKKIVRNLEAFAAHASNLSHAKLTLARAAALVSPDGNLAQLVVAPTATTTTTTTTATTTVKTAFPPASSLASTTFSSPFSSPMYASSVPTTSRPSSSPPISPPLTSFSPSSLPPSLPPHVPLEHYRPKMTETLMSDYRYAMRQAAATDTSRWQLPSLLLQSPLARTTARASCSTSRQR